MFSIGRALLSLGEDDGDGGHRYTKLDPFAEVVTRRMARRVSAMTCDGCVEILLAQDP